MSLSAPNSKPMARTAFITGASSDIGIALCRCYLDAGWRVIAHHRTPRPDLDALAGPTLELWRADFADTATLERSIAENPGFFTRADALANLAADPMPTSFEKATAADILRAVSVNFLPGLLLMQAMGPAMSGRGFGRIVHASSIGVKFGGGKDSFAYSLSKHAQEFIPAAARSWAANNVLVNVIRIGVTDTRFHARFSGKDMAARARMIPAGRMATPDEIAQTLFWFGSDRNGFATDQVVSVAGGE